MASQLLVQAARAVALERLTNSYARSEPDATTAFPIAAPAPEALADSESKSPVTNCNGSEGGESLKMVRRVSAAVNVVPPSTTVGVGGASGVAYGGDKSGNEVEGRCGDGEDVATRVLTAIFPRGRFREGSSCAPTAAVVRESWALLVEALAVEARGGKKQDCTEGGDRGGAAAAVVVDPEDFPLLLGERLHADVVGGLAANLLDVEVRAARKANDLSVCCTSTARHVKMRRMSILHGIFYPEDNFARVLPAGAGRNILMRKR